MYDPDISEPQLVASLQEFIDNAETMVKTAKTLGHKGVSIDLSLDAAQQLIDAATQYQETKVSAMSSFEEAIQVTLTMLNHRIKETSDRDVLTDEQQEYIDELSEKRDQLLTELDDIKKSDLAGRMYEQIDLARGISMGIFKSLSELQEYLDRQSSKLNLILKLPVEEWVMSDNFCLDIDETLKQSAVKR